MTPKELIDKITLAAEQLESLRTEHDLPVRVEFADECVYLTTANKKHELEIVVTGRGIYFNRSAGVACKYFDTYEELVEDIKNR